ncbi:hypothetical protein ACEF07_10935 [Streptococcus dysgalactiae]
MDRYEKKAFILTRLFIYIFVIASFVIENLNYKFIFYSLGTLLVIYDIFETYYNFKKK